MLRKIERKDLDPDKKKKGVLKKVEQLKMQLSAPLPEDTKDEIRKKIKQLLSGT